MNSIMAVILFLQGSTIMISEILYDPEPVVGLPVYEFVEWYNSGGDTVDLTGWQWVVGDKVRRVPGGRIAPGGYVIVCSPAAATAYRALGAVIAIESFPALRNTGDRLTLLNPDGKEVQTVDYSPDQFTDALKANGGWSLELADFSQYCNPMAWMPSVDPTGGTPGRANSQQVTVSPADPPVLIRAAGYDDRHFVLLFSGMLSPELNMNNYSCTLTPGMIAAPAVPALEYGFPGLFFQLPDNLDPGLVYQVDLTGIVNDCTGQDASLRTVRLGFPSEPDSADVVITEILFNPQTDQTEFIEVYNRSERIIDLQSLIVARAGTDGNIIAFSDQQDISYWLFPDCYAVFPADEQAFKQAWPLADPAIIAGRSDLPALVSEESQVMLLDRNQKNLDIAVYSPDWHYPYLDDDKGVSLERIDYHAPGTDRANWFSASTACGGSTPGAKNSVAQNSLPASSQQFTIDPSSGCAATSPDAVQLVVRYRFGDTGWFLKIKVFNSNGQFIRDIFPYGMAAAEGLVCWDGLDSGQRIVPDGIYLVVADYYHPTGKKGRWKKACAVVRAY